MALVQDVGKGHYLELGYKAFQDSKGPADIIVVASPLQPMLNLVLACDASAYRVGAFLAHNARQLREAHWVHCHYRKQKRTTVSWNGNACIFGNKRFNLYMFGHHFNLITVHKQLQLH